MPISTTDWTVEMLEALPDDGKRYEIIDGELFVTPAPSVVHQQAVLRMAHLLLPYVDALRVDLVPAPIAVTFSTRREVQPDLSVWPRIPGKPTTRFTDVGALLLAIEVLSPHTSKVDRGRKRTLYQEQRTPEYWIVDTFARTVERWLQNSTRPDVFTSSISWQPVASHEPLVIDLVRYFRLVHGEYGEE